MKVGGIVIAPEGCEDYLTAGKEYLVESIVGKNDKDLLFMTFADNGQEVWSTIRESSHLNMGDWILSPTTHDNSQDDKTIIK